MNSTPITDIQKAVQFYYLITRSFGGKGNTFGTVKCSSGGACKSLKNVPEKIDAIHKRLDKVMIENRDFEKLIKQYDFENAFFYCHIWGNLLAGRRKMRVKLNNEHKGHHG